MRLSPLYSTRHWLLPSLLAATIVGCDSSVSTSPTAPDVTSQQIENPALPPLFIRGSFNGWGTKDRLMMNDGVLSSKIRLSYGVFEFKFATDSWSQEFVVQAEKDITLDVLSDAQRYDVSSNKAGGKSYLMVTEPGQYLISLNTKTTPFTLSINKTSYVYPADVAPHQGETQQLTFNTYDQKTETATFSSADVDGLKEYVHETTAVLRDPVPSFSVYKEDPKQPYLRSGNTAFDALFALAIDEMKLDAVEVIRDNNYNDGNAIACSCFETGEKWNYVWTRDLAYSAHLSLGFLDPQRVTNSLNFKLSPYRNSVPKAATIAGSSDGLQIIQDTGSGGSWPISTDRVTWAFGATSALNNLTGQARNDFANTAFTALSNTIEIDRQVAFDQATGLYNGEQSFLDWREQSYAPWIKDDLSSMATSKSISTNTGHYQAIKLAKELASELNKPALAKRYAQWQLALKQSINKELWLADKGMYSSLTAGHFDNTPLAKFDWLGQSLAIITGIADDNQRQQILSHYPHGVMGAPVIFPQQPDIGVYHNRAIWPFVTAYGLKAAKVGHNAAVANSAYQTLIRGAAINLSNMENLEWLSAQAMWLEKENPALSGPAINSKRQLWSVAGYLNMVIESLFGIQSTTQGLVIEPLITTKLHQDYFAAQSHITLNNLNWHGKKIDVTLQLPTLGTTAGIYNIASLTLNGKQLDSRPLNDSDLTATNTLKVTLTTPDSPAQSLTLINAKTGPHDEASFAPRTPTFTLKTSDKHNVITIDESSDSSAVIYQVYRNGQLVKPQLSSLTWQDSRHETQACYSVSAIFISSGNASHHSPVQCQNQGKLYRLSAENVTGNQQPENDALLNWGAPKDTLQINSIEIKTKGSYALSWQYHNMQHQINTGITAGVKWMTVRDNSGKSVASGVVQMPHNEAAKAYSTPLISNLDVGSYQIALSDFFNMSYLKNNHSYSGAGGTKGPVNKVDLFGLRVMKIQN